MFFWSRCTKEVQRKYKGNTKEGQRKYKGRRRKYEEIQSKLKGNTKEKSRRYESNTKEIQINFTENMNGNGENTKETERE